MKFLFTILLTCICYGQHVTDHDRIILLEQKVKNLNVKVCDHKNYIDMDYGRGLKHERVNSSNNLEDNIHTWGLIIITVLNGFGFVHLKRNGKK